jgi:hypothetical protein
MHSGLWPRRSRVQVPSLTPVLLDVTLKNEKRTLYHYRQRPPGRFSFFLSLDKKKERLPNQWLAGDES